MKRTLIVLVSLVLLAGVARAAPIEPVKLIGGPGSQSGGWRNGTHVVFNEARSLGAVSHTFARDTSTGEDIQIDMRRRGGGGAGGIDPRDANRVIYAQALHGSHDLYFFDLATGERRRVPGVHSRVSEFDARISSSFILFVRYRRAQDGRLSWFLMLHDRTTRTNETLARYPVSRTFGVIPGSVGERYATWTRCSEIECRVLVHDRLGATYDIARIPQDAPYQYASAVDEVNGNVYFARTIDACGEDASIRRVPLDDLDAAPEIVAQLPEGFDIGYGALYTALWEDTDASVIDLNFQRWNCEREAGDLYSLPAVDTIP
jgi:hypothetical protein